METMQEQTGRVDKFMALVDRYTSFDELTTPMLNEFVEKVVVHERMTVGRYKRKQRVDVYFNFIGLIELPAEPETEPPAAAEPPQERYVAANTSFAPLGKTQPGRTGTPGEDSGAAAVEQRQQHGRHPKSV